jgi:TIR domain
MPQNGDAQPGVAHPTAIISYAHDSEEHRDRVLALAQELRQAGIDCTLDRFVDPVDWALWMETEVRKRAWVVVVASEAYLRRSRDEEEAGRGRGARWEYALIRQMLYEASLGDQKFVPVIFAAEDTRYIPDALRTRTRYDVSRGEDRKRLVEKLAGRRVTIAPVPLGPLEPLQDLPVVSSGATDFKAEITIAPRKVAAGVPSIRPRLYLSVTTPEPGWIAFGSGPVTKLGSYRLVLEIQNKGKGAANRVRVAMEGIGTVQKLGTLAPRDKALKFVWELEKEPAFRTPPDPAVVIVECIDDDGVAYRQIGHLQVRPVSGGYGYSGGNLEAPETVAEPQIAY